MSAELINNTWNGKCNVPGISKPVLIIHGSADQIVPLSSSQFIHDNIASEDKKMEVIIIKSNVV